MPDLNYRRIATWTLFLVLVWPAQYILMGAALFFALPVALFLGLVVVWLSIRTTRKNKLLVGGAVGAVMLNRAANRRHSEKMAVLANQGGVTEGPSSGSTPFPYMDPDEGAPIQGAAYIEAPPQKKTVLWKRILQPVGLSYVKSQGTMTGTERIAVGAAVVVVLTIRFVAGG